MSTGLIAMDFILIAMGVPVAGFILWGLKEMWQCDD